MPKPAPAARMDSVASLKLKLMTLANKAGASKSLSDFDFVNETDVENYNQFIARSDAYHSIGDGERKKLTAYMGNSKGEYRRAVKGFAPQTPEVPFRANFAWLTEALTHTLINAAMMRNKAMKSPEAQQQRARGMFTDASWNNHMDQVFGSAKSTVESVGLKEELDLYCAKWQVESRKYQHDPKSYRFSIPLVDIYGAQDDAEIAEIDAREAQRRADRPSTTTSDMPWKQHEDKKKALEIWKAGARKKMTDSSSAC